MRPPARVLGSREEQPARTGPPRSCPASSPPPLPRPLRSWQEGFRLGASGCRACPVRDGAGSASRATPVRSSGCSRRPGGGDRGRSTGDPAESRRTASRGMCSGRMGGWGVGPFPFRFNQRELERRALSPTATRAQMAGSSSGIRSPIRGQPEICAATAGQRAGDSNSAFEKPPSGTAVCRLHWDFLPHQAQERRHL